MQTRAYMQRLIELDAKRIVVPGNLPIGCTPIILTLYASHSKSDYDKYGCLDKFNDLARYHNELLRQEVQALQDKYNLTKIAFADYFLIENVHRLDEDQVGEYYCIGIKTHRTS
jgi:hypothetical protein